MLCTQCSPGSTILHNRSSMSSCPGIGGRIRRTVRRLIFPAISAVFIIGHVAETLDEPEDWIHDLSIDTVPEDGCLHVHGVHEDGGTAGIASNKSSLICDKPETRPPSACRRLAARIRRQRSKCAGRRPDALPSERRRHAQRDRDAGGQHLLTGLRFGSIEEQTPLFRVTGGKSPDV
ncbi:MAG: hypothetical protein JWM91_3349 [Rhodospirillales bacterium]|nr:hypothetical protein [Rhodospirillales bacterium]